MASPYSLDLRKRVIEAVGNGMNYQEAAEIFSIGEATVKRWFYRFRDEGHVHPRSGYQNGHSHKITNDEEFIALVTQNPSQTSAEIAAKIGNVSASTVRYKLKCLGFSRKKRSFCMLNGVKKGELSIKRKSTK